MSKPKYSEGDLVRIGLESNMHRGDLVILSDPIKTSNGWRYDFVIPEQRGSVPEKFIEGLVLAQAHTEKEGTAE